MLKKDLQNLVDQQEFEIEELQQKIKDMQISAKLVMKDVLDNHCSDAEPYVIDMAKALQMEAPGIPYEITIHDAEMPLGEGTFDYGKLEVKYDGKIIEFDYAEFD